MNIEFKITLITVTIILFVLAGYGIIVVHA